MTSKSVRLYKLRIMKIFNIVNEDVCYNMDDVNVFILLSVYHVECYVF